MRGRPRSFGSSATGWPRTIAAYTGVREPGGTALGNEIRRMLLEPGRQMNARAEALLFMASRAELIAEVVKPALERGELVLADRFFLSTYAYQVVGRGLPFEDVRAANKLATAGLVPDLTILLTLPASIRDARVVARGGADRIESAGRWFHELVEGAFNDCAAPRGRLRIRSADRSPRSMVQVRSRTCSSACLACSPNESRDVFQMRNAAHA